MWLVRNKIWAGDYKIFVNKPTRNEEGYWEDLTELGKDRRYGYIILENQRPVDISWEDEPKRVCICLDNKLEDIVDEPIYMIAHSEKGPRDWYDDYNYGWCPLSRYACNSVMSQSKELPGSSHGYGCAGYVVKTTMKYLKMQGWESDYEKYKTSEEVWNKY